jgi:hypothetical protein
MVARPLPIRLVIARASFRKRSMPSRSKFRAAASPRSSAHSVRVWHSTLHSAEGRCPRGTIRGRQTAGGISSCGCICRGGSLVRINAYGMTNFSSPARRLLPCRQ